MGARFYFQITSFCMENSVHEATCAGKQEKCNIWYVNFKSTPLKFDWSGQMESSRKLFQNIVKLQRYGVSTITNKQTKRKTAFSFVVVIKPPPTWGRFAYIYMFINHLDLKMQRFKISSRTRAAEQEPAYFILSFWCLSIFKFKFEYETLVWFRLYLATITEAVHNRSSRMKGLLIYILFFFFNPKSVIVTF